jgi:hypothetical protein
MRRSSRTPSARNTIPSATSAASIRANVPLSGLLAWRSIADSVFLEIPARRASSICCITLCAAGPPRRQPVDAKVRLDTLRTSRPMRRDKAWCGRVRRGEAGSAGRGAARLDRARQGKARFGVAGLGAARQGAVQHGKVRQARCGLAWQGRRGKAWPGTTWQGLAWCGGRAMARYGRCGAARYGWAGQGKAGRGTARRDPAGLGNAGTA